MDTTLTTAIVSTSGAVITGVFGMFFTANQLGRRIDDLRADVRELRAEFSAYKAEFYAFKDVVNGKFAALDAEIGKLLDRQNPR